MPYRLHVQAYVSEVKQTLRGHVVANQPFTREDEEYILTDSLSKQDYYVEGWRISRLLRAQKITNQEVSS